MDCRHGSPPRLIHDYAWACGARRGRGRGGTPCWIEIRMVIDQGRPMAPSWDRGHKCVIQRDGRLPSAGALPTKMTGTHGPPTRADRHGARAQWQQLPCHVCIRPHLQPRGGRRPRAHAGGPPRRKRTSFHRRALIDSAPGPALRGGDLADASNVRVRAFESSRIYSSDPRVSQCGEEHLVVHHSASLCRAALLPGLSPSTPPVRNLVSPSRSIRRPSRTLGRDSRPCAWLPGFCPGACS